MKKPLIISRRNCLPQEFYMYGYQFKLLSTELDIALYSQEKDGKVYAYEVHRINSQRDYVQPKSAFGRYAWSYEQRHNAERKYEMELENEMQKNIV